MLVHSNRLTPWYEGTPLAHHLMSEEEAISETETQSSARMAINWLAHCIRLGTARLSSVSACVEEVCDWNTNSRCSGVLISISSTLNGFLIGNRRK